MSFGPETMRGAPSTVPAGVVEFRLARNGVVTEFRKGRLSRLDICDAHPELLRAAVNCGSAAPEPCPICEADDMVHVVYVFGSRMPASGRCITSEAELSKLRRGTRLLTAYQVEVCPACSWNHLFRMFPVGRTR